MTYFPSVRTKNRVNVFTGEETDEPNGYWEGNLNDRDKVFVRGYDCAIKDLYHFFNNLDCCDEFDWTRFNVNFISEPPVRDPDCPDDAVRCVGDDENYEYKSLADYSEEQLAKMTPETAITIAMRAAVLDWMERERNMTVVSILDDYALDEPEGDSDAEKSAGSD